MRNRYWDGECVIRKRTVTSAMSPEAFNHTMPRGLLPRQLKVLGFLDHLSCTLKKHFDPFYLFPWPWRPSSVKRLCVWKLRYWSNLSAVNLRDVLSASCSWVLWEMSSE